MLNGEESVNNELPRMGMETIVAVFDGLYQHSIGGT
jgi:hypothetical protein